jgi:hypothetical protein
MRVRSVKFLHMPTEDIMVDKAKFDALLQRLINSPPTSMEATKAVPKIRKDGQPKRSSSKTKPS